MAAAAEPFDFAHTGRGQRAVRDIRKGEVVLSVPLDECWTPTAARAALGQAPVPVLPALERLPEPRVLKTPLLALHLLLERTRGAASPRHAHVLALPSEFDTPLHWAEGELEVLRGCAPDWHAFAVRAREEAALDFGELEAAVGAAALHALGADRASYLWASTAFQSRLMDVQGAEALMAPGLDLFNHTADPLARGSFGLDPSTRRHVRVTAYRDFAAGDQVFISYGAHANARLLFSYGFALGGSGSGAGCFEQVELIDALPFGPACADQPSRLRSALALRAAMPFASAPDEAHAAGAERAPPPLALDIPSLAEGASAEERRALRLLLRHALSLAQPLPTPLLVSARLAELDGAALLQLDSAPALLDALANGAPLSAHNEAAALARVGRKLSALASSRARTPATEERAREVAAASERGARRVALVRALVDGEAAIISSAERALEERRAASAAAPIRPLISTAPPDAPADARGSGAAALAAASAPAEHVRPLPLGRTVAWADAAAAADTLPDGWAAHAAAAAGGSSGQRGARVLVCTRDVSAGELLWSVPLAQCYSSDGAASDARVAAALGAALEERGVRARCLAPLLLALERSQALQPQPRGEQRGTEDARSAAERGGAHPPCADGEHADRASSAAALARRVEASPPLGRWDEAARAEGGAHELPSAALAGSRWLAELADADADLREDWRALELALGRTAAGAALLSAGALSGAAFRSATAAWQAGVVEARAEGGWPCPLLVPALADGCVHDASLPRGASLSIERDASGEAHACVRALAPCAAGGCVRVRLGYEPAGEQLLRRGFLTVPNAHDRVELSLTLACTARTLEPAMLAAPEAPADLLAPSAFEFVRVPTDAEAEAGGEEGAPLVTRHSVSRAQPLAPALLALLRLERLAPSELAAAEASLGRRGLPLWCALQRGEALSGSNELHALHAAEAVALTHLEAYRAAPGGAEAEGEGEGKADEGARPRVLRCSSAQERSAAAAAVLRAETGALRALAAAAQAKRRELVGSFTQRMHRLPGRRPHEASPWLTLLRASRPRLERLRAEVAATCARLVGAVELCASLSAAAGLEAHLLLARFCASAFGWLMGCAPEPEERAQAAPASGSAYGQVYASKVQLWGCFLLAQWTEATTLGLAELNAMLMESVDIRSRFSWSVPSARALELLCSLGPLSLSGDANGTWLSELRARGADVESLEPAAQPSSSRALVVCWPDARGAGLSGLETIRAFGGAVLATLGEWRGRTYGAYADGLGEHGQSFSAECQRHVTDAFGLRAEAPLPNWPLARDALLVWERTA